MICLCRATLRKNKIVVLDEATANIDVVTEKKILDLISSDLVDATVITVAHRLNTVEKSDKILLLSQGKLIKFESP